MSLSLESKLPEHSNNTSSLLGRVQTQTSSAVTTLAQLLTASPSPLSALPHIEISKEEVKKLSLLSAPLPPAASIADANAFLETEGRLLAHVLGDGFISNTVFEGYNISVTANHMVHSLDLLTSSRGLFDTEEIALLQLVKAHFTQLAETNREILALEKRENLLTYCTTLASKIERLAPGQSLYLPGGWASAGGKPGHAMLYEVIKQPNGQFTLAIFNSGAGLESFHDQAIVGNKNKYKPVVEYRDIPKEELLITHGTCQGGFFLAALLEPRIQPAEGYEHPVFDEKYIYGILLNPLEQYRHAVPNQTLSGFISAQRSGTCCWKVNNAILRVRLPHQLYKKCITMIKANTLLETWRKGEQLIESGSELAAQLRELYHKSAAQLNRRLAKTYTQLPPQSSSYKEWILCFTATTMEMLDHLADCAAKLLVEKRARKNLSKLNSIDEDASTRLKAKVKRIDLSSPTQDIRQRYTAFPSTTFQVDNPATLLAELKKMEGIIAELTKGGDVNDALLRGVIESLVEKLPLPSSEPFDPFWDQVKFPEECLSKLWSLAETYTWAAMGESDATFSEITTFFTFYGASHKLTLSIEREEIARAKQKGQTILPLFQKCAVFVQNFDQDRFFFSDDAIVMQRMEKLLCYFKNWNSSCNDKVFGSKQLFCSEWFTSFSSSGDGNIIDFKFYEKLIEEYQLKEVCQDFINQARIQLILPSKFNQLPSHLQQSVILFVRHMDLSINISFLLALGQFRRLAFISHFYKGESSSGGRGNYHQLANSNPSVSIDNGYGKNEVQLMGRLDTPSSLYKSYYNKSCYIPKETKNSLFPPMDKSIEKFIESESQTATRHLKMIGFERAEAAALSRETAYEGMNGVLLPLLERACAEPELQPSQVLAIFHQYLPQLGGQSTSLSYQILLLTHFFKTFVKPDTDKDSSLYSPAIEQLANQPSLRAQVAQFVDQGLNFFWKLQLDRRPKLDACLFLIQFVQRVRFCLRDSDPEGHFLSDLESKTLDHWIDLEGYSNRELGAIHLHRLHGYCATPYDRLTDDDLLVIITSWIFWKQNPVEADQRWHEVEHLVQSYCLRLLMQNVALSSSLLEEIAHTVLKRCGIREKASGSSWNKQAIHPHYRKTYQDGSYWEIDLATGVLSNENGLIKETKRPHWIGGQTYKRLFGDRKHNYQTVGGAVYFIDPQQGSMRCLSHVDNLEAGLECLLDNRWCKYQNPIALKDHLPYSLLSTTNLWVMDDRQVMICKRENNERLGLINTNGEIVIEAAQFLEGARENEKAIVLRKFEKDASPLLQFERHQYIEQRYRQQQLAQLSLPRYRSSSNQPLVFDYDLERQALFWRHDGRYILRGEDQKGLLPSVNNYLILNKVDSQERLLSERKLIVPCQQMMGAPDLCPTVTKGLDIEDKARKSLWRTESEELDVQQIGVYYYLDYGLTAENQLIAHKPEERLFLAYLYLQERSYAQALSYLKTVEKVDGLSRLAMDILQWIITLGKSNHDICGSAAAIRLHAIWIYGPRHLKVFLEQMKKLLPKEREEQEMEIKKCLKGYQEIYLYYIHQIGNVEKNLELSFQQENDLYRLLKGGETSELLENRQAFLRLPMEQRVYPAPIKTTIGLSTESLKKELMKISALVIQEDETEHSLLERRDLPNFQETAPRMLWPSERPANFFNEMAEAILNANAQEKQVISYKLSLIVSKEGSQEAREDALLIFLAIASDKLIAELGQKPSAYASLRVQATWYQKLISLYNKNKLKPERFNLAKEQEAAEKGAIFTPLLLKEEPWAAMRRPANLPALRLDTLLALPEQRHTLCRQFFIGQLPSQLSQKKFAITYDPTQAPKEESAHAFAIAKEYADFVQDFNAGQAQLHNQIYWQLTPSNNIESLSQILTEQQDLLAAILRTREQEMLNLANAKPTEHAALVHAFLHEYSGLQNPLTTQDLVLLFLKQNHELYIKANPVLRTLKVNDSKAIDLLTQKIGEFLWLSTERQTLERALILCDKISSYEDPLSEEYHIQLLAQELSAEHHYNPAEHPEFLVFEYCSNILIRKRQIELLELMVQEKDGRYADAVIQLIMGGGKTSVLASLLCHMAAKPDRLSLFITPASQYETVKENLKKTQRHCFNQSILPLDFRREELTPHFLSKLVADVQNAIDQGEMALMKVESLQMLELEFVATLRSISHRKKGEKILEVQQQEVRWLRELLQMLRSKGDALIDEVDLVLNALQTVNFPEGSRHRVPTEEIELVREIYQILSSTTITVTLDSGIPVSLKDFVGLHLNRQTLLTSKEILEKLAPAVAEELAKKHNPLMLQEYVECFTRYVSGKINSKLQQLIGDSSPNKEMQLDEQERQDLKFLNYLRDLYHSKNKREQEAANLAALTKHLMRTLMPITLGKSGGRHYGRTRGAPAGKVVPYMAVDTPATTEFGYHYEALCYQFQTALQFGINKEQLLQLGQSMRAAAEHHMRKRQINFDETAEAIEFLSLTGIRLADIEVAGKLEEAIRLAEGQIDVTCLLGIEAETCVETVSYHAERLESTAQSVIDQVNSRRAFSGTPWNSDGYHPALVDGLLLDVGTEGQIASALLDRISAGEGFHVSETENPGLMLRTILKDHPHRDRIRGFMDPGGLFKKSDNETVARSLLCALQEMLPSTKGILFFYRPKGKATADTLALLKPGMKDPILIEGTSYESIQKVGVTVEDYFVYYDDRHTTGTDILQVPSAINLVTVDETLLRRSFFQAVLRLRQFFFNQTVEFVIPRSSQKRLVAGGITIEGILESTVKNQAIHKSKYLFRCFKQMMENTFRQQALAHLLSATENDADVTDLFLSYEPFLVGMNRNSPYEAFGKLDTEVPSLKSLNGFKERLGSRWKAQGLELSSTIETTLKNIIVRAEQSPVLQTFILEPGSESIGVEQEVSVQLQAEVQSETEVELEQELQEELQRYQTIKNLWVRDEVVWVQRDWEKLIIALQKGEEVIFDLPSSVEPLSQLLQPKSYSSFTYPDDKPYHKIFGNLLGTYQFANPLHEQAALFHKAHRPAEQLLVVQRDEGVAAVLLSAYEAQQLKIWLNDVSGSEICAHVWLVQADGALLVDNALAPLPSTPQVRDLLLMMNAFNGNADYLDHHPHETLRWFSADNAKINGRGLVTKTHYLKMRVERNPMQRKIFYKSGTLQPEKVAAGTFDELHHLARASYNRRAEIPPEKIPEITDKEILQALPDENVQFVAAAQVPHLLMTQHHLLRMAEQLAAIPRDSFSLDLCSSEQVPLFAPWQIDQIRDNRLFLHRLMKNQVNLIHPDQVNNLTPKQIGWITKPELLQLIKNSCVPYVNRDFVDQLTDIQVPFLQEEQIAGLSIERLSLLSEEQLHHLSSIQIEEVEEPALRTKLNVIKWRISQLSPKELESITKLFYAHMHYLSEDCLNNLSTVQLSQFKFDTLHLLPDDKLAEISEKQLGSIKPSQTELIHRLRLKQLPLLTDAALSKISSTQLNRINDLDLLKRISEDRFEDLDGSQINWDTPVEFLKKLPAVVMPKLSIGTVYWIPYETYQEMGIDKVRGCSFFQKLVLTIHYLVVGLLKVIGELMQAMMLSPLWVVGYPVDKDWNRVWLTVEGVGWSLSIWLPASV